MLFNRFFWGFIEVRTQTIITPIVSDEVGALTPEHHGQLARHLGYANKEDMIRCGHVAFELPKGKDVRADFILWDTRDRQARRAVKKFLYQYDLKYDIKYVDISSYKWIAINIETVEDAMKIL